MQRKAFTLIELLVVIAIIALLIGILLPALGRARDSARQVQSLANVRSIGQSSATYASDFDDTLFGFTWTQNGRRDFRYQVEGEDGNIVPRDTTAATRLQMTDILRRRTGLSSGSNAIPRLDTAFRLFVYRRFSHLVLYDYLSVQLPVPIAVSPSDRLLLDLQEDPINGWTELDRNNPDDNNFRDPDFLRMLAYSSSYQIVPAAWAPDEGATVQPVDTTTNLFANLPPNQQSVYGRRKLSQVSFPSMKVHMFEEFDYSTDKQGLFYAYEEAQSNLLFFDGSADRRAASAGNPGWRPSEPNSIGFRSLYKPLIAAFPAAKNADDADNRVFGWFRWTRRGLKGVDYGGGEVGVPEGATPG